MGFGKGKTKSKAANKKGFFGKLSRKVLSAAGITIVALLGLGTYLAIHLLQAVVLPPAESKTAILLVDSTPTNARVILDGEDTQTHTPARFPNLPVDTTHTLWLTLKGHESVRKSGDGGRPTREANDGTGHGFLGTLHGQPVIVRQLPDDQSLRRVMAVYDPPLPGVPSLVRVDRFERRVTLRNLGTDLSTWIAGESPDVSRRVRVLIAVTRTLGAAHQRGRIHGGLVPRDIRVAPGDLVFVDGWHRVALVDQAVTRIGATADRYAAPEQMLGQRPTAASDIFALGGLLQTLLDGADTLTQAMTAPTPAARPDAATVEQTLLRLRGLRPRNVTAPAHDRPTPPTGPRYVPHPRNPQVAEDTLLGRRVEIVPIPPGASLARLRALARPGLPSFQEVLACSATGPVVLEHVGTAKPPRRTRADINAIRRDLERIHADGVQLGATPSAVVWRQGRLCIRLRDLLFLTTPQRDADARLLDWLARS